MAFQERVKISQVLTTEYADFLSYCNIAGKVFCDELTPVDFVAFRSQFGLSRDDVKTLKRIIEKQEVIDTITPPERNENDTPIYVQEDLQGSAVADDVNNLSSYIEYEDNVSTGTFNEDERIDEDIEIMPSNSDIEKDISSESDEMDISPVKIEPEIKRQYERKQEDDLSTYADIFHIDLTTPSLDAEIEQFELSVRSFNALKHASIRTLKDLLLLTPDNLIKVKNLGVKSIKEIESLIDMVSKSPDIICDVHEEQKPCALSVRSQIVRTKFYELIQTNEYDAEGLSKDEIEYINSLTIAKTEIGDEMAEYCIDIANHEKLQEIMEMLRTFVSVNSIASDLMHTVQEALRKMPSHYRTLRLLPFASVYAVNRPEKVGANLQAIITEEDTINDIVSIISNRLPTDKDAITAISSTLADVVNWISNIDVVATAEKIFELEDKKSSRASEVYSSRCRGQTLEQIAQDLGGLTRERVRQIEQKAFRVVVHRYQHSKYNLMSLYYALRNGDRIIQKSEVDELLGSELAAKFWYTASRWNKDKQKYAFDGVYGHYDAGHDVIVLRIGGNKHPEIARKQTSKLIDTIVQQLPEFAETEKLNELIEEKARETDIPSELLKIAVDKAYSQSGLFSYKSRLTVVQMCDYILKNRFVNGYKIADETDSGMFLRYMNELFGKVGRTTARAIDAKIMDLGVLVDRGKYVHKDYFKVPGEVMDSVSKYIDESPRSVLSYVEIFSALEDLFVGTDITNRYALQGAIKLYGCKYNSHRDYITKESGGNIAEEFSAFIKEHGIVHKSDILEEFIGWQEYNIAFVVPRCPEVIGLDMGYFMHSSQLDLDDEENECIEKYLNSAINDIPVSARYLFDVFMDKFTDFMIRNDIQTHSKLFGILRYLFADKFYFSRPYIAKEESNGITNKRVLLKHIEDIDAIELSDFLDLCNDNAVHYVSVSYLLDLMRPELIRIDANMLMKQESIGLDDSVIADVAELVSEAIEANGGFIAATNINDLSWYPQINIPWTTFLVESVVGLIPTEINTIKLQSSSNDIPHSIFTSEEYQEDDYNSLVVKLLIKEHKIDPFPDKHSVFEWLQDNGLCNTKYPSFLDSEQHVYEMDGKLVIE